MGLTSIAQAAPVASPSGPDAARTRLWTLGRWSGALALSVWDQALASGAHFGVNLLLARWLPPADYGAFALAYAVFLFAAGVHNAVILEPMGVIGPARFAGSLPSYLGALFWLHAGLTLAIGAVLLAGAAALAAASPLWRPLVAVGLATPGMLLFWLARRACYLASDPGLAARGSLCYALLVGAGLLSMRRAGWVSPEGIFLLMAGAGLAISLGLASRMGVGRRDLLRELSMGSPRAVIGFHRSYARWSLGATMLYWLASSAYLPLVASSAGLRAAAAYRAADNLLLPMSHTLTAAGHLLLPWLSLQHSRRGSPYLRTAAVRIALAAALAAGLYVAAILAFGGNLMRLAYGTDYYAAWFHLVPLLGAAVVLRGAGDTGLAMALRAAGRPEAGFWATAAAAGVTLTAGLALVSRYGAAGAAWGWMLSSAASTVACACLFRSRMR